VDVRKQVLDIKSLIFYLIIEVSSICFSAFIFILRLVIGEHSATIAGYFGGRPMEVKRMRRVLTILFFFIVFILLITVPFYIWGVTKFAAFSTQVKSITDITLVTLEFIGILVTSAVVITILFQYFRYRRPYRLVFDAFSNEPDLINNEKKPLNLSILVQEELINQFKIIYNEVHGYSDKKKEKQKQEGQDFEAFGADELYIEEGPLGNGIGTYVSVDQVTKGGMIEDLKEVIEDIKDPKGINLMSLIGEIVPKDVAPVSKFIEAIIPPHVIMATAYLQWRSSVSDDADKVGITFKYVDLSNQRNLMVRTLWWQPPNKSADAANASSSAKVIKANKPESNKVADRYIELLSPSSHWMALMFWEQKLLSNVPPLNRILKRQEKRRQARIFYLMGALYYAHADQFPTYHSFFCQLAVEHFRQALITDASWNLPYLYMANLYSFKAQETKGEKSEKLSQDADNLYKASLEHTKKGHEYTRHRILIAKALADLATGVRSKNLKLLKEITQQVEELQKEIDPAIYDPSRADCAAYLYNLATWYTIAFDETVPMTNVNSRDEARRYLAYSLARSPNLKGKVEKDQIFKNMRTEGDLELLLEFLEEVQHENPKLADLTGDEFKCKLDSIPQMIDQRLGRGTLRQQA
jgi:hypothetical protein